MTTRGKRQPPVLQYFRTMGIARLRGRDFEAGDRAGAPAVAVVSETLAKRLSC
jgi:hypothetical protein